MHSMARHKDYSFGAIAEVWFASVEVFLSTQTGKFMYAEAILDAVGGGRVVPGPSGLARLDQRCSARKAHGLNGIGRHREYCCVAPTRKALQGCPSPPRLALPPIPVQPRHT